MDPRKLHRRILIVLGVPATLLVDIALIDLATDHTRGVDRIGLFLGALFVAGGYLLHAALSSIFVGVSARCGATTCKGVVLAHIASILALCAWCVLLS